MVKEQQRKDRWGLIVLVTDAEGHVGMGEAAPLSGMSVESIEEAAKELKAISRQ